MMYYVPKENRGTILSFFEGCEDTLILSCLQGYMGDAYVDDLGQPSSVCVLVADFCFLAGEPNETFVASLFDCWEGDYLLVVAEEAEWHRFLEAIYPDSHTAFMRYAIKKEKDVFDKVKLQSYIDQLPSGFTLMQIDEVRYHQTQEAEWSKDLCAQFKTYEDYANRGLGYVVMHGDQLVCGASSYTVYAEGIEIEIDTREDYRRQGLALACAAQLIFACLDRGLYPSWDAANKASVALCEKLGYHFDHEYITYLIEKSC
ncbi:MAG: GNAT family N-acetyltransferase [Cellulosilyticaceae bacterium]